MKTSTTLIWLSILIALLTLVATGAGLFWQSAGDPYPDTGQRRVGGAITQKCQRKGGDPALVPSNRAAQGGALI